MNYVNAHTHQDSEGVSLVNLSITPKVKTPLSKYFSVGIHPWDINSARSVNNIEVYARNKNCVAIGETGIDRSEKYASTIEEQRNIFKQHIKLAATLSKPLIIHCVKGFSEVIEILTLTQPMQALLFHDYNGNQEITQQLLRFNSFFGYGDKLFNEESKGYRALESIPFDRLLLETDDSLRTIEEVYLKTSKALKH